jgi:membrane-associated phospholipid phosphatase
MNTLGTTPGRSRRSEKSTKGDQIVTPLPALRLGLAVLIGCFAWGPACAKTDIIETSGTAVAVALPIAAGSIALYHDYDWQGVAQMIADTGATVGTAYLMKFVVKEERPDHTDNRSFPSDTAALAFAPAQFLWDRYGWEYGLPAYAAAAYSGYSRVEAQQHHWWDVAASAGMAFGYSKIFTARYLRVDNVETGAYLTPHAAFVSLKYRF